MARIIIPESENIVNTIFDEMHKYGTEHFGEMPGGIQLTPPQFDQLRATIGILSYIDIGAPYKFIGVPIFISDNPNNAKEPSYL